jgi:hypothetical protein
MTCQECEIKLGMGEDAGEHLAGCTECRGLARELRLNSVALREMKARPRMKWERALAAAAAILMAVFLRVPRVENLPLPPVRVAVAPVLAGHGPAPHHRKTKRRVAPAETLRVKMFTSDPDVVIYWIVDKKDGYE